MASDSEQKVEQPAALTVLGEHTLVPTLLRTPQVWESIPLLRASKGKLPPYMLVVGDRRRVAACAKFLERPVVLSDEMKKRGGDGGRVEITVGTYKGCPVAVVEGGMGPSTTEIICREVLSSEYSSREFAYDETADDEKKEPQTRSLRADAKYIIRIGTCAGINTHDGHGHGHGSQGADDGDQSGKEPPAKRRRKSAKQDNAKTDAQAADRLVKAFDVIVTSHQVGMSGTDLQSVGGKLNFFDAKMINNAKKALKALGCEFQGSMPILRRDVDLAKSLHQHAIATSKGQGRTEDEVHFLGNFSKDSLYSESDESDFVQLRAQYDCGSTEMEYSVLSRLAAQLSQAGEPVKAAMVMLAVGIIPGASFFHDAKKHQESLDIAIISALETFSQQAAKHSV